MSNFTKKISGAFTRLKNTYVIIGIILWGISIWYLFYYPKNEWSVDNLSGYITEISAALFCGIIITLTWDFIIATLGTIKNEEILTEIHSIYDGFRLVDLEQGYNQASKLIVNCKFIRIIGAAQQDHQNEEIKTAINNYLNVTLRRIKNNAPQLKYRRISNTDLNDKFQSHIKEVLAHGKASNHNLEMIFFDHFAPFYTYLIVDESFMMLIINHPPESDAHCEQCLITENRTIIKLFKEQFTNIFEAERKLRKSVKTGEQFEKYQQIYKKIHQEIEEIVRSVDALPTIQERHMKYLWPELSQLKEGLQGLKSQRLNINHTLSNGNLLSIFCTYLNNMKEGDMYKTITFYEFWQDIVNKGDREPDFKLANLNALKKGAIIERLLVIDQDILRKILGQQSIQMAQLDDKKMQEITYFYGIQQVIKLNIEIQNAYPIHYRFRILVSSNHQKLRSNFFNFAIVKEKGSSQQQILFQPANTEQIGSTKIFYYAEPDEILHKTEFENKERQLNTIDDYWKAQNVDAYAQFFLKIDKVFFGNPENQIKVFGRVFKK
jgi:hypothetical protein